MFTIIQSKHSSFSSSFEIIFSLFFFSAIVELKKKIELLHPFSSRSLSLAPSPPSLYSPSISMHPQFVVLVKNKATSGYLRYVCTYVYACVCAYIYICHHDVPCITSNPIDVSCHPHLCSVLLFISFSSFFLSLSLNMRPKNMRENTLWNSSKPLTATATSISKKKKT